MHVHLKLPPLLVFLLTLLTSCFLGAADAAAAANTKTAGTGSKQIYHRESDEQIYYGFEAELAKTQTPPSVPGYPGIQYYFGGTVFLRVSSNWTWMELGTVRGKRLTVDLSVRLFPKVDQMAVDLDDEQTTLAISELRLVCEEGLYITTVMEVKCVGKDGREDCKRLQQTFQDWRWNYGFQSSSRHACSS
jgi:hypothetical protein